MHIQGACAGLFGTTSAPLLDVEPATLYRQAADKMAGKMSISGIQEKVSLALDDDKSKLRVVATGGRYILKPGSSRFSAIPENEHVTMRMAGLAGIDVPPLGLVRMKGNHWAYLIRRFDRLDDGSKLQVEDFCQLAGKPLRDKYRGSGELCVKLLRRWASEPLIEVHKLYRLFLFCWWSGNGDMHLKNFSMLTLPDGLRQLSPAYDLVCTQLVIPGDRLAMPIAGRDAKLTRRKWLEFGGYCEIPPKAVKRVIDEQADVLEPALRLVGRSFLPESMKANYEEILRQNTAELRR